MAVCFELALTSNRTDVLVPLCIVGRPDVRRICDICILGKAVSLKFVRTVKLDGK
jgi:hypothetical protein